MQIVTGHVELASTTFSRSAAVEDRRALTSAVYFRIDLPIAPDVLNFLFISSLCNSINKVFRP